MGRPLSAHGLARIWKLRPGPENFEVGPARSPPRPGPGFFYIKQKQKYIYTNQIVGKITLRKQAFILTNNYFKLLCKNIGLFTVSGPNCVWRSLIVQPALLKSPSLATVLAGIEKINRANKARFGNFF